MLHTPIHPAADAAPDPDITQAIADFRGIARRIRDYSSRLAGLRHGPHTRAKLEHQIETDMAALNLRAERIGGGWTGESLLEVIQMDIDSEARRVAQPSRQSARTHLDRVQAAIAREATAKAAHKAATLELEAATSARMAAEHASREFAARRAAR